MTNISIRELYMEYIEFLKTVIKATDPRKMTENLCYVSSKEYIWCESSVAVVKVSYQKVVDDCGYLYDRTVTFSNDLRDVTFGGMLGCSYKVFIKENSDGNHIQIICDNSDSLSYVGIFSPDRGCLTDAFPRRLMEIAQSNPPVNISFEDDVFSKMITDVFVPIEKESI